MDGLSDQSTDRYKGDFLIDGQEQTPSANLSF